MTDSPVSATDESRAYQDERTTEIAQSAESFDFRFRGRSICIAILYISIEI